MKLQTYSSKKLSKSYNRLINIDEDKQVIKKLMFEFSKNLFVGALWRIGRLEYGKNRLANVNQNQHSIKSFNFQKF